MEDFFLHAGDLAIWNADIGWWLFELMVKPVEGQHIDYAMIPLDNRRGNMGNLTVQAYMEMLDIDYFTPMHMWDNYAGVDAFANKFPEFAPKMIAMQASANIKEVIEIGEFYEIPFNSTENKEERLNSTQEKNTGEKPVVKDHIPVIEKRDFSQIVEKETKKEKVYYDVSAVYSLTVKMLKEKYQYDSTSQHDLYHVLHGGVKKHAKKLIKMIDDRTTSLARLELNKMIKGIRNDNEKLLLILFYYYYLTSHPEIYQEDGNSGRRTICVEFENYMKDFGIKLKAIQE